MLGVVELAVILFELLQRMFIQMGVSFSQLTLSLFKDY